jgi:hypothetical protein
MGIILKCIFKEEVCKGLNWIKQVMWQAVVNTVMQLRTLHKVGNLLISWETVRCWMRTRLHWVSGIVRLRSRRGETHAGGRHAYDGVLHGAPKGSFTTLPSQPQYHAAFSAVPRTLASVDQSPVCRPRTLPPSATRTPRVGFLTGSQY